MQEPSYTYYGILFDKTADDPNGVVRVWTDEHGKEREETFGRELIWETSDLFDPLSRPVYRDLVEIDKATVERFQDKIRNMNR